MWSSPDFYWNDNKNEKKLYVFLVKILRLALGIVLNAEFQRNHQHDVCSFQLGLSNFSCKNFVRQRQQKNFKIVNTNLLGSAASSNSRSGFSAMKLSSSSLYQFGQFLGS